MRLVDLPRSIFARLSDLGIQTVVPDFHFEKPGSYIPIVGAEYISALRIFIREHALILFSSKFLLLHNPFSEQSHNTHTQQSAISYMRT
jgi:hypothetical protein